MIKAMDLAALAASKARTPAIPYKEGGRSDAGTDCINLVGWCVEELGGEKSDIPRGSNTAWRTAMQWRGTLAGAKAQGKLLPGALLYICDGPTADWPDGDYSHVGIYIGQEGLEVVHASASRGGVYPSTLKNGWTHVAWLAVVSYEASAAATDPVPATEGGSTLAKTAKVIAEDGLRMRATPGGDYMLTIAQGAEIPVLGTSTVSGTLYVQTSAANANGTFTGWVAASDVAGKAYLRMIEPEAVEAPEADPIQAKDAYQLGYGDGHAAAIEDAIRALQAMAQGD